MLLTCDTLFNGNLLICQRKRGYRFAIDAVLLAGLTRVHPNDRILDLGTGCGVISLIFAYRKLGKRIVGLEIQPELVELARHNVRINEFGERIEIDEGDYRELPRGVEGGSFDLVVSNPPYRRLLSGRLNLDEQRAVARHELKSSVDDVGRAARRVLRDGGRLSIIYPATRLGRLLATVQEYNLSPKQLTVIHSNASSTARLVYLECRKGAGEELRVTPPFFIYSENGAYTEAMRILYEGCPKGDD